jgi:hypothetical protein
MSERLRDSKYRRGRGGISWFGLLLGLALGVGGALAYAWLVEPIRETQVSPWQLREQDRAHYMVAIILNYHADGDLNTAIQRLIALQPPNNATDPIQAVAETACRLAGTGYVDSPSGLRAIRLMMQFYQLQQRTGCADVIIGTEVLPTQVLQIVVDTPTPDLAPSKTPLPALVTPSATPRNLIVPTLPPQRDFALVRLESFCDAEIRGVIEVYVQDGRGEGIPGQAVRVRWGANEQDIFYSGLMPERGTAYADFQMQADVSYTIDMPGRANPSQRPIAAAPCQTDSGEDSIQSYRAVFRPAG